VNGSDGMECEKMVVKILLGHKKLAKSFDKKIN
jgi:hypothetical protein